MIEAMNSTPLHDAKAVAELRHAIETGELVLHYQPKLDLRGGELLGVEALVRWQHPRRGLLEPTEFLPLAQHTGLIHALTVWVLEASLRQQHEWRGERLEVPVSVNLSMATLHDPELPSLVDRLLRRWDVPPAALQVEITESDLMAHAEGAGQCVAALRALDVGVAIDDFGTGCSSLSHLTALALDEVKIDRSFVRRLATDPSSRAIIRAVIDLAYDLGLRAVAEGMEDSATWDLLVALGCDLGQGYYICPPVPPAELSDWLRRPNRWHTAESARTRLDETLRERTRRQGVRLVAEQEFLARKQAEEALRESEQSLRLALDAGHLGTWQVDLIRALVLWTPEAAELFGLPPGNTQSTLGEFQRLLHPEDWPVLSRSMRSVAATGKDGVTQYRVLWPDGTFHWLEGRARGFRDASGKLRRLTGTVMEITERKRAEEEIRFQAGLLQAIDQSVITRNLDGTIRYWNDAARKLYGWSSHEALGQPLSGLIGLGGTDQQADAILDRVRSGQSWSGEVVARRRDGATFPVLATDSPIYNSDGVLVGIISVSSDLTERKQAEEERARLAAIVTSSDIAIFACNLDGVITTWNRGAERLYGYAAEEIIGNSSACLAPPGCTHDNEMMLARTARGEPVDHVEAVRIRKDGSPIDVSISVSPIYDTDGRVIGAATIQRDITQQRRAQDALRERETQLAEAQRIAHLGSWELDLATKQLRWSDEHFRIVGLEPRPDGLSPINAVDCIHPEDCSRAQAMLDNAIAARGSYSTELRIVRPDGEIRWIHSRGTYVPTPGASPGRMVGTAQDVTERVLSEAQRAQLARHLHSLLSSTSEGIYGVDPEGRCAFINVAGAAMLGYAPGELVGQAMHALIHGRHPDGAPYPVETCPVHQTMRSGMACRLDTDVLWRRDGTALPVEFVANPLVEDGRVVGVVVAFQDITERKRAEACLREADQQREIFHRSEKLRALGQMASGVAHDLNQSLMLIASYSDLARDELDRDPLDRDVLRDMFATATQAALDGGETVKRLLQFARAPMHEERKLVDLVQVAREAASLTAPRWRDAAQSEGRPISLQVEGPQGVNVLGSPGHLREAITNLLFNAVDALPRGGTILLRVSTRGQQAVVEVIDSGVGMSAEVRARIFEPFFTSKGEQGTGLGLAQVFGIVDQHGGQVDVQSTLGRGTTVRLSLPLAPNDSPTVQSAAVAPARPEHALRILIVDDEPAMVKAVARMLRPAGHVVRTAGSGEEALEHLAAEPFDVVVSDLGMGAGMNGWDLAEAVRRGWPRVRFVLATGWGAAIDQAEAAAHGVEAVLAKPYLLTDLQRALMSPEQLAD
jgi:PAS domain S-box-containing protein